MDQTPPLWLWAVFAVGWTVVLLALLGGYLGDWIRRHR